MKKTILIIIGVIAILVVGIIGYFVITDFRQEQKLDKEIEELIELGNSETLDEEKINKMLNRTVTTGDYQIVEQSFKEYLSDAFEVVYEILDILNDEKLVTLLTIDNYLNDGPNFVKSKKYILDTKTRLTELNDEYYSFLTEAKAMSYIEDKGLDKYYVNLYKNEYVGDLDSSSEDKTVEDSINQVVDLLNTSEEIMDFLYENRNSWIIEDDVIIFDTDNLLEQYNNLVDKLA